MTASRHPPQQLVMPITEAEPSAFPGDNVGWRDIFLLVRRRLVLIIGIVAAICLLALPAIMAKPKLYYAQTRIMIEPSPTLALTTNSAARTGPLQIETEIEQLLSFSVSGIVIDRYDLAQLAEFNRDLRPPTVFDTIRTWMRETLYTITSVEPQETGEPETPTNRVMGAYRNALSVSRQGATNVVTVGFASEDPMLAEKVPSAVVATYFAQGNMIRQIGMSEAIAWLGTRIDTTEARVEDIRAEIDRVMGREGEDRNESIEDLVADLQLLEARQRIITENRAQITEERSSIAAALEDTGVAALAEPPRLKALRDAVLAETVELDRITLVYGDSYNEVSLRRDRIAALAADIEAELSVYDLRLDTREDDLDRVGGQLVKEIAELREELDMLRRVEPEIARLTDALQARRAKLLELEATRSALVAEADVEMLSIDVLAPPVKPVDSLGPSRMLYLLGTLAASTLFGMIIAAIVDLRDGTIRSAEQLPRVPRATALGLIPRPTRRQRRDMGTTLGDQSHASVAEGLRDAAFMLKTASDHALLPLLVVAGSERRDDVGTVGYWLALTLARSGTPVWLVYSGDMTGRNFSPPDDDGIIWLTLSDLCADGQPLPTAMAALETRARAASGIVIVTAPPLHELRGLELAQIAGRVLLVMRWGGTPRVLIDLIFGLVSRLHRVQLMTLIVDVNPRRHRLYGFSDRLSLVQGRVTRWWRQDSPSAPT